MFFQTLLETPIPRVYIRAKVEGQKAGEAHLGKHQFIAGHREPYLVVRRLLRTSLHPGTLLGLPKGSRRTQHATHGSPSQAQGRLSQCALLESHHMGAGWLQGVELELP